MTGTWRKSSWSFSSDCVEAGHGPGGVAIRDTADRSGPALRFTPGAWAAFTAALKAR